MKGTPLINMYLSLINVVNKIIDKLKLINKKNDSNQKIEFFS